MSDRLDDDVLLLVLDELATPSIDYWEYCDSKEALSNTCLVSRRLRALAQPRLFRQIWVVEQRQADALRSSAVASSLGRGTVWFTVGRRGWPGGLPDAVEMAHVLPNVEKLLLSGPSTAGSLARIASFTKLRHLSLVFSDLGGSSMIFTAPHLEQLDIHLGSSSTRAAAEWLQPVYLPALRILSVVSVEERFSGPVELSEVLGDAILAQLDVVQTNEQNLEWRWDLALGTAPPVLFFAPPPEPFTLPRHSVHPMQHAVDDDDVVAVLRRLTAQAQRAVSSSAVPGPRSVVLPRRVLSLSEEDYDVNLAVHRFEQVCGRTIRIIWTGDEGMDVLSGGVSREFVEYARELKAAARTASALEG